MNNVKTTKELKEIILNNGMTIESTGFKGRYKVISKDGLLCKIVRFSNAKKYIKLRFRQQRSVASYVS